MNSSSRFLFSRAQKEEEEVGGSARGVAAASTGSAPGRVRVRVRRVISVVKAAESSSFDIVSRASAALKQLETERSGVVSFADLLQIVYPRCAVCRVLANVLLESGI